MSGGAPREILLATRNRGKAAEVRAMLEGLPATIRTLEECPGAPDVVEDGLTFRDNALKKARGLARWGGGLALADDSGLEVDALGGAPGVWSARYAGPGATDAKNNSELLRALEGIPLAQRSARFRCVLALAHPDGREWVAEGACEGRIALAPRGETGFGYDPLFLVTGRGKTFAELGPAVKNRISHRAKALAAMKEIIARVIRDEPPPGG
jgi:XTP/dITP diphosphohydrolase